MSDAAAAMQSPPPFKPSEAIELNSVEGSKITGVSVYQGRAEITRLFQLKVRTGQNQVHINGLPSVLDHDSLKVEGRGAATIHDVTISYVPRAPVPTTSPALKALLHKKDKISKGLERYKKSMGSLDWYLSTLNAQHIATSELKKVMADYEEAAEELDVRGLQLDKQLQDVDKEIEVERGNLTKSDYNEKLNRRVSIGLFVESEGEIEIALIYAVHSASWSAGYDIRVDMQAKGQQVTLVYKAGIAQSTGEDWTDVPLTLETATPTFGIGVPSLNPWNLSIFKLTAAVTGYGGGSCHPTRGPTARPYPVESGLDRGEPLKSLYGDGGEHLERMKVEAEKWRQQAMGRRRLEVLGGKGNVSATFQVPGMINIPSDGDAHNVTITELRLSASMSWVCVPKKDTKVHLTANVKNVSEYTLLRGTGSVYVDGSFISRSAIPAVSPGESFDCPLGLDPSIRVTYHPRVKKVSQSGFYTKNSNHVYSQHITVFNTKATSIEDVRIVDQVPVSEDEQIKVKLVSPTLTIGGPGGESSSKEKEKSAQKVGVAKGIVAQWDEADEMRADEDAKSLGENGKMNWLCSVPPQGKVNLVLQWEITAPVNADVVGL